MELFSNILVPLIILYIVIYGKSKNIDIYDSFVKGAVDGLKSAWSITPYIIGIFLAIGVFKTGGGIEALEFIFKPIANLMSIPKELIGLIIVKPLSGVVLWVCILSLHNEWEWILLLKEWGLR